MSSWMPILHSQKNSLWIKLLFVLALLSKSNGNIHAIENNKLFLLNWLCLTEILCILLDRGKCLYFDAFYLLNQLFTNVEQYNLIFFGLFTTTFCVLLKLFKEILVDHKAHQGTLKSEDMISEVLLESCL